MTDWGAVGLSAFEAQVYRQLLRDPGVPVRQLSDALEMPTASVEAAITRLAEAGLVRHGSEDAPAPVDPRSGIGMLVRDRRAALDGVAAMTDQLAREFNAGQLQAEPSRLIEIAIGRGAIESRIDDLLRGATIQAAGTDTRPMSRTAAVRCRARSSLCSIGESGSGPSTLLRCWTTPAGSPG